MTLKQLVDFYNLYSSYYGWDDYIIFDDELQDEVWAWWLDEFANTLSLY